MTPDEPTRSRRPDRSEDVRVDVDQFTAVAQDYLKVIWSATEWGGPPITTKDLALRFATSAANVSETVKRLASQGLIDYQPYKPVTLTPIGTDLALAMVRRHRLVETFLVTTLGYDWNEVHDEAERLEHAVSDTMIDRIAQLLGHPSSDPHGDPIPSVDGAIERPGDTLPLGDAPSGRFDVVRISDADPDCLDRLGAHGIRPGSIIDVATDPRDQDRARAVTAAGAALAAADIEAIWVRPRLR
ncbi:MAG: metal-dependent transcriptional regulator [Dermatophilaceae bacterium]